jgi:hypothetical protein
MCTAYYFAWRFSAELIDTDLLIIDLISAVLCVKN